MTKFLGSIKRGVQGVFYQGWFIWLLFLAVLQPDYLVTKQLGVLLFNLINVAAFLLIVADIVMQRPRKIHWGLFAILLVQACLVISSLLGNANVVFSAKKMLMVANVTIVASKNLKHNPLRFINCLYLFLFTLVAIHFVTVLAFPTGMYTSYYQYINMIVPYLRHWFLSTGNNFVLFALPAMFLDRIRLYRKGAVIDWLSLALYAMCFYTMVYCRAATSLAACGLFFIFALLLTWKKLPNLGLTTYTLISLAVFVLLVFCDLGGILGNMLGSGPITFGSRVETWEHAIKWVKASPLLGYGYELGAVITAKLGGKMGATHCHNLYLDLLYRTGIVGLAAFLATVFFCAWKMRGKRKQPLVNLLTFTLFMYMVILFQMEAYFSMGMFYVLLIFGFDIDCWNHVLPPRSDCKQRRMTIYICETVYHVMLATLLLRGEDNLILCTTHEKKNMENFRKLRTKSIPEAYFLMRFRDPRKENLGLEMLEDRRILSTLQEQYGFRNFDLVNFAWSANSIDRSSAYYYKKCRRATFYEEGAMGCIGVPQSKKKLLVKQLLGIPVRFHGDKKLQAVYVQNPDLYDDRFGDKLRSFDLRSLMEDSQVGSRVVGLFMDEEKAEKMSDINGKSIIFTQPLSEDGYISEERKVEIYSVICDWFNSEQTILKIHPRDTSDYAAVKANVLRETFPGELFDVLGVRFDAAVGICTSAVNNVDAAHPVNLNPDFLKDTHFDAEEMADLFEKNGVLKSQ